MLTSHSVGIRRETIASWESIRGCQVRVVFPSLPNGPILIIGRKNIYRRYFHYNWKISKKSQSSAPPTTHNEERKNWRHEKSSFSFSGFARPTKGRWEREQNQLLLSFSFGFYQDGQFISCCLNSIDISNNNFLAYSKEVQSDPIQERLRTNSIQRKRRLFR